MNTTADEYGHILRHPVVVAMSAVFLTATFLLGNPLLAFVFWYENRPTNVRKTVINLLSGSLSLTAILANNFILMMMFRRTFIGPMFHDESVVLNVFLRCWGVIGFLVFNEIIILRFLFLCQIFRVGALHDEFLATFFLLLNLFFGFLNCLLDLMIKGWYNEAHLLSIGIHPGKLDPNKYSGYPTTRVLHGLIGISIFNHLFLMMFLLTHVKVKDWRRRRMTLGTHVVSDSSNGLRDFSWRLISFFTLIFMFILPTIRSRLPIKAFDNREWLYPLLGCSHVVYTCIIWPSLYICRNDHARKTFVNLIKAWKKERIDSFKELPLYKLLP